MSTEMMIPIEDEQFSFRNKRGELICITIILFTKEGKVYKLIDQKNEREYDPDELKMVYWGD
jgi:hypothetical protein